MREYPDPVSRRCRVGQIGMNEMDRRAWPQVVAATLALVYRVV